MPYGNIITAIYLKVSVSDFLTLFSARTDGPFFSARPGWLLLFAGRYEPFPLLCLPGIVSCTVYSLARILLLSLGASFARAALTFSPLPTRAT